MNVSFDMVVILIQMACVIVVVAQVVTASPFLRLTLLQKGTWRQILVIAILFGLLSIYGTYSGLEILGAKINIRDLGPMIAGLIAGPYAGIGAGLIGGIQRYSIGGITAIPCSLATILAGLIGGLIYLRSGKRFCGVRTAVCFAILMEGLHMLMQLSMVQPFSVAYEIVATSAIPMIVANALGMAAFSIIVTDYLARMKEKGASEKGD
ncbi:LytS/YhcK type 5TM receptor domain-containing protein [uncultured Methanospirillum sp.]|uniref:LytS/YhcK type 5TM receptor domain-containing protein n=1 Tax=uncultured Methanospirillum sp. TaxID=262503 RepID=UPI0029C7D689|nr:LytS/YhcK type 5TM receptor domain-containing protein [uncultured Methanospirillum sp.]